MQQIATAAAAAAGRVVDWIHRRTRAKAGVQKVKLEVSRGDVTELTPRPTNMGMLLRRCLTLVSL